MESNTPLTVPEQFRANEIIWVALIAGVSMIGVLFYFTIASEFTTYIPNSMFFIIAVVLTVSCIGLSYFMYNKRKSEIPTLKGLDNKLAHFRSTFILRMALLEGPALLSLMFMFIIETNINYLFLTGLCLAFMYTLRPTKAFFEQDYNLSSSESVALKNAMIR